MKGKNVGFRGKGVGGMRDKKRIDRILGKIRKIWEKNPDLRLNQLLICFGGFKNIGWNVEDDEVERMLNLGVKELG